jgi:hypothetical protein
VPKSVTEHCCAWKECRTKFLSSSDLLKHIQEDHLSFLPSNDYQSQRKLTCQWRKCLDTRCYPARYKLLLHLQRCHCNSKRPEQVLKASFCTWQAFTLPKNSLKLQPPSTTFLVNGTRTRLFSLKSYYYNFHCSTSVGSI